ncbi:MAG: hypothetical protein K2Q12_07945 [Rickettsiales bacterium]|nr:hypothetical protein [Rickettsiales bacterium]
MSTPLDKRLEAMEKKLSRILRLAENNAQAINTLYRRTIALAQMVEALHNQQEPRVTRALRSEIDASLRPEEFIDLARRDPAEFMERYGEALLQQVLRLGIDGVGTMGELAPQKAMTKKKLQ